MVTRLYPNVSNNTTGTTFTPDSGWEVTTGFNRRDLTTAVQGEAFANNNSPVGSGTNPNDVLIRQYIWTKRLAPQTMSGTLKGQFLVSE